MKRFISFAACLLLATTLLAAQTVNINLLWSSPVEEQQVLPFIEAMIGGCLMELFEQGFMGTNSLPKKADKAAFTAAIPTSEDAEAFIDYEVYIYIEITDLKLKPAEIQYRIVKLDSGKEVYKGKIAIPTLKAVSRQEYMQYYHTVGTLVIKDITAKVSMRY